MIITRRITPNSPGSVSSGFTYSGNLISSRSSTRNLKCSSNCVGEGNFVRGKQSAIYGLSGIGVPRQSVLFAWLKSADAGPRTNHEVYIAVPPGCATGSAKKTGSRSLVARSPLCKLTRTSTQRPNRPTIALQTYLHTYIRACTYIHTE